MQLRYLAHLFRSTSRNCIVLYISGIYKALLAGGPFKSAPSARGPKKKASFKKEFGEAFGRLFDHRPVLQGEISFCQREFEEKRGNREETRLQKCLEYGREINEKLIPQIIETVQTDFPKFSMSVAEAVSLSQQIMEKENKPAKSEWLEQRRLQQSRDWSGFLNTMTSKVSDIDNEFANEVALVKAHYSELEEKLKITDRKERTEIAQHNPTEIDQNNAGVDQEDKAAVADTLPITQEVKVGDGQENKVEDGQEVKVGDGQEIKVGDGQKDRVGIVQKDKTEVDCGEEIAPQGVQENRSEVTNSVKLAEEEMVKVSQDNSTDIL